jgi:hypothetical protein
MFESLNILEWIPIVLLTLAGMILLLFKRDGGMSFLGILILVVTMMLVHEIHQNNLDKAFVLKRFNEAHAITCASGYRGEHTLIDLKSGWRWDDHIGFIKGDQIHNDLGVCKVIGEEAPTASIVPYAFALLFELILGLILRGAMQKALRE